MRISSGKGMLVWIQMCHAVMLLNRKSVMRMWGKRRLVSKQPYTAELLKMFFFLAEHLGSHWTRGAGGYSSTQHVLKAKTLLGMSSTQHNWSRHTQIPLHLFVLGMRWENLQCKLSQWRITRILQTYTTSKVTFLASRQEQGQQVVWFHPPTHSSPQWGVFQNTGKCFEKCPVPITETVQSSTTAS